MPSLNQKKSKKPPKSPFGLYLLLGVALMGAFGFLFWTFTVSKTSPIVSSQQQAGELPSANTPYQASQHPAEKIIPTQEQLMTAMLPDAQLNNLDLKNVQILGCTPQINVFANPSLGNVICKVNISISKKGSPSKEIQMNIHAFQSSNKNWIVSKQ